MTGPVRFTPGLQALTAGGGECAGVVGRVDWATTSLGTPETWPVSLRVTAATVMNAASPMALYWGPDLVAIYNDAFRDLIGDKHPAAMGRSARDVFPEVWESIGELFAGVLAGAGAARVEDQRLALIRHGHPEDAWFSYSFNPVPSDSGGVGGVLVSAVETTRQVAVARRDVFRAELEDKARGLSDPRAMAAAVIDALGRVLELAQAGFGEIVDHSDTVCLSMTFGQAVAVDDLFDLSRLGPAAMQDLRASRTFVSADLGSEPDADPALLGFASCVCVPIVRDGDFRGAFYVAKREARRWSAADASLAEEVTGLVWEILKRANVETALTSSEAHWRGLFERLHEGLVIGEVDRDADGKITGWRLVDMNSAWEQLLDLSRDAAIGRSIGEIMPGAERGAGAPWLRRAAQVVDSGRPATFTCQLGAEGRWFEGRAFATQPERFAVLFLEVTARRQAEAALRESEDHYRHAVELDPQTTWTATPDGQLDRVNQRWMEWTGTTGLGETWAQGLHEEDRARTFEVWGHCVATGEPYDIEHRVKMRDGDYRWMHSRAYPRRDAGGHIVKWYGSTEDIHERWMAQYLLRGLNETLESQVAQRTAALQSSQAQLRTIFETSYQYQGLVDLRGRLLDANATALRGADATLDELIGKHLWETPWFNQTPALQPVIRKAVAHVAAGGSMRQEITVNLATGERIFDFSMRPVRDADGRVVAIVPEAVEITERRRAEQALRQSQKMEAVGQLTGGIAHDFNNMLAVVIGSLDLLGRRIGFGDARARRYVEAAIEGARRAALLTQRLLAFSRQQPLNPQAVDIDQLVVGLSDLIRGSVGPDVRLETSFAPDLWRVHADPNQLENVLLNLAVNARDAMPAGGRLLISAANVILEHQTGGDLESAAGEYVLISITDSGVGMSAEVIARAFDPFFTTKEVGKGTGLGLSQVYGFVTQSGGRVGIESEPGRGTAVKVYLPRFVGEMDAPRAPSAASLALGRRQELILVVEDEAAVRQLSVDALTELGYAVIEADSASAALQVLEANGDVALLFTDIVMPEINGRRLAEAAVLRRPALKVLFTTGYSRDALIERPGDVEMIAKPFSLDELAARVREVLDRPSPVS